MSNDDRGVYSPPPDEYDRFDVSEDDDTRRGPLLLVVAVAVLIALIAVIYTAYNQGVRSGGRNDAPLIAAPTGPIKSKPQNPGGKKQPSTTGAAYDPLDAKHNPDQVKIAPPTEQPIVKPKPPAQKKVETATVKTPAPATNRTQPIATPTKKPTSAATDGDFVVQIGSFRSEDQAKNTWETLRNRLPIILDKVSADIQRADLGAKGVYFRLRAASFTTRATANQFCASLKAKGQDCIVVKR